MTVRLAEKIMYFTLITTSCAPPSEEMSSVQSNQGNANANEESTSLVDYGGAAIGDDVARSHAQSCIESGKFYDRTVKPKPACTVVQLARTVCREDAIKKSLSNIKREQFENLKADRLSGYQLDQCVDCSTPVSRKTCKDNIGRSDVSSGTMITFVKEIDSSIDVKIVYVPK
jgi:hypothetical protein